MTVHVGIVLSAACAALAVCATAGRASAQPTATPTPVLAPLDRFDCYAAKRPPAKIFGVTLDDRLGPGVVDLKKLVRLCAPTDVNGEDPSAPDDPDHLGVFALKQTAPRFTRVSGVVVTDRSELTSWTW